MAKNKITDLRNIMFETMERLMSNDKDDQIDIEKAKAIADLGKVVVDSARVELDLLKSTVNLPSNVTQMGTGFLISGFVPNQSKNED